MADLLRHRGPDGHGEAEFAGGELKGWFGHRRLKILDLSELAHQPMASDDGRVLITYNGEIYNFRELRRELVAAGYPVRSSGDTEVVLRAYEAWGEDFVSRLDGMFALAVWDGRRSRLLLARDRAGKKPLFYAVAGGRIAFGSEIKSVLAAPFIERRANLDQLGAFLVFGYVPNPDTLYESVRQVPPSATVMFDADGLRPAVPYWSALPRRPRARPSPELAGDIAALLDEATRRRMVSDVPLGALLSGGIDSSLVVGLMARASEDPVHTFSIGFADDPSYDERDYARLIAQRFRTRHVDFDVRMDATALLDRLIWHHDQPFHDSSAIPTYVVCQLAREHVTVVLNGDGGDEVFGGYDRFRAAALAVRAPTAAIRALGRIAQALPIDHGYHSRRRRLERFLEMADRPMAERYQSWISVIDPSVVGDLLAPGLPSNAVVASMERCYAESAHLPSLDRILYANFRTYLSDDLAVKMDRMSMAHSLEARSPFLDTALVELLGSVRARDKVGLRRLKPLLRQAFGPLLPTVIWDRPKHGFGVPMGSWFRGELGTVFEDEVLAADARCAEFLRADAVRRIYQEHRAEQRDNGAKLWTILTLERWLRTLQAPPQLKPPGSSDVVDARSQPSRSASRRP